MSTVESIAVTGGENWINTSTSSPDASGIELFSNRDNHGDALASILNSVQNKIGYFPQDNVTKELFLRYVKEVGRIPFLFQSRNDKLERTIYSKDYNKLIHDLADVFHAMTDFDFQKFKTMIVKSVKNVLSCKKATEKRAFFGQFIVSQQGSDILVNIYHTALNLQIDETGKTTIVSQTMVVNYSTYKLNSAKMIADSPSLAVLEKKRLDDWLEGLSSTQGNAVPCIPFQSAINNAEREQKYLKDN